MTPRVKLATAPRSAVSLSVRGDVTTSPGQLSISKADAKRALDAFASPTETGITILDTIAGDTSYSLRSADSPVRVTSQTLRTISPFGDTTSMRTSVDTSGVQLSGARRKSFQVDSFFDIVADNNGSKTRLRAFGFESSIAVETEGVGIVFADTTRDTSYSVRSFDNPTRSTIQTLRSVSPLGDIATLRTSVDTSGAQLSGAWKKGFQVDSFFDVIADNGGSRSKLRAFGFESSIAVETEGVGIAFIDTTQTDTVVIIRADSSGNSGGSFRGAKKVAKFKAGADLASKVNRMLPGASRAGALVDLIVPVDHYVEISVDSLESSMVFADTSGNVLMMQKARHDAMMASISNMRAVAPSGDTADVVTVVDTATASVSVRRSNRVSVVGFGSVTVTKRPTAVSPADRAVAIIADDNEVSLTVSQAGGGFPGSDVRIADLDANGSLDVRVGGDLILGAPSGSNILTVAQGSATDPIADAWTTYSSRRWKKNIEPIQGALDKVKQLRGVEYDWKASGKHDIGLIAEEVGAVIPEVVVYEENGVDAKSVDYPRLVALLIQALKEQQTTIEAQQGQIDGLKQNLVSLQTLAAQVADMQETLLRLTNAESENVTEQYGMK